MNPQDLADPLHAQILPIIEIQHNAMAVREVTDRLDQHGPHLGALELNLRIVPHFSEQAPQAGLLGDLFKDSQVSSSLDDFDAAHGPADARPRPRSRRTLRLLGFGCADAFLILPFLLANAARKPVHRAGAVEDGSPNPVLRVGLQEDATARVKAFDGLKQADDPVAHQILKLHRKPQPHPQGFRDQPHLRHVEQQQPLAFRRGSLPVRSVLLSARGRGGGQDDIHVSFRA